MERINEEAFEHLKLNYQSDNIFLCELTESPYTLEFSPINDNQIKIDFLMFYVK